MKLYDVALAIGAALMSLVVLFVLYILFVYAPVDLWGQEQCLKRGFPEHRTTVTLDVYCLNIEGVVQGKVVEVN